MSSCSSTGSRCSSAASTSSPPAIADTPPLAGQIEDLIASLVDKSLVTASRGPLGSRYHQLETVRQYGQERLAMIPRRRTSSRKRSWS
jgi:hypothetical protein